MIQPGGNEGTVKAYAVAVGQEEVPRTVFNIRAWFRACPNRRGANFEASLLADDYLNPVQGHAIKI